MNNSAGHGTLSVPSLFVRKKPDLFQDTYLIKLIFMTYLEIVFKEDVNRWNSWTNVVPWGEQVVETNSAPSIICWELVNCHIDE